MSSSEHHPIHDDEALIIDIGQLMGALKRQSKVILAGTLVGLLGFGAFAAFFYQDKYRSEATVLFNPADSPTVISQYALENRFLQGEGKGNSSFKNQEELLRSRFLAETVLHELTEKKIQLSTRTPDQLLKDVLSFNHVNGTDFIKVGAVAEQPKTAQTIARIYLQAYKEKVRELSLDPLTHQYKLLRKQAQKAEVELRRMAAAVRDYQEKYGIVSITDESQLKVRSLASLNSDIKTVEASLSEKSAEIVQLRKQLHLKSKDIRTALQAVASGEDHQLLELQTALQTAEREYAEKGLIYAPTNPDMRQLQEKIEKLRAQITNQNMISVGLAEGPGEGAYRDSVRRDMVDRLVRREAEQAALHNKLATMRGQAGSLAGGLKQLPTHQLEYARLTNDFNTRQEILTRLKEKLAEIKIQQSAIQESLTEIDAPNLPNKPVTTPKWQLVLLGGLIGCVLSALGVLGHAAVRPHGVRAFFMEHTARIPVLSVIPWLSEAAWQRCRSRNTLEVLMNPVDADVLQAYQDFALNLKARRDQNGKNALTVASIHQNAAQSVMLGNLAYCLAQSGERVVIVDTNLRDPKLQDIFGHTLNYEHGLPELINSLSETMFHKPEATVDNLAPVVESALMPSGIHPQLHYINAGVRLENTFEFLNSKGFASLVKTLKAHYDWVLFDAPPFLSSPDAAVELRYLDGLLLLVEQNATESQVQLVNKKVRQLNADIIGCAMRVSEK